MKRTVLLFFVLMFAINVFAQEKPIKKHYFSLKASDILISRITIRSEYILDNDGKVGLYVPFSVYIGEQSPVNSNNRILHEDNSKFYTGIGMLVYPFKSNIFIDLSFGTEVRLGRAYDVEKFQDNCVLYNKDETSVYAAFLIVVSAKYDILRNVYVGFEAGAGPRTDSCEGISYIFYPAFNIGIFL